jgi:hypothetical protein
MKVITLFLILINEPITELKTGAKEFVLVGVPGTCPGVGRLKDQE